MMPSATVLSRLSIVFGILSVVTAAWGIYELALWQNPIPILLVGSMGAMTGVFALLAQKQKAAEGTRA